MYNGNSSENLIELSRLSDFHVLLVKPWFLRRKLAVIRSEEVPPVVSVTLPVAWKDNMEYKQASESDCKINF